MKFKRKLFSGVIIAICILTFACSCLFAQSAIHVLKIKDANNLSRFFRYTGNDPTIISGHRGGNFKGYPENSIAAFEHILKYTPAMFEIDPRLTKDSVIVLMHDATLERTTNGTGKVADYTWDELRQLKLKDAEGNITNYGIPTLSEAIKWAKGKTVVNLDKKDVPLAMTAALIRKHKAEAYVMITVHTAEQAHFYHQKNHKLMFSAFVKTKSAMEEYEKAGVPWSQMIAYIGSVDKKENQEMFGLLHARGVMCMISTAPVYDKLQNPAARKKAYQEIESSGADIIESDLPLEVQEAVQSLKNSKSPKNKYFGLGKI